MEFVSIISQPRQTWVERAKSYAGSRITQDTIPMLKSDLEQVQYEIDQCGAAQSQDHLDGRQLLQLYLEQVEESKRPCRC